MEKKQKDIIGMPPILVSPHDPKRLYFASQRVWKSNGRGDLMEQFQKISPITLKDYQLLFMIQNKNGIIGMYTQCQII